MKKIFFALFLFLIPLGFSMNISMHTPINATYVGRDIDVIHTAIGSSSTYNCSYLFNVSNSTLLAYWRFDDDSNALTGLGTYGWLISEDRVFNGTKFASGSPIWNSSGKYGGAFNFNGTAPANNVYIYVGTNILNITDTLTVCAWVTSESITDDRAVGEPEVFIGKSSNVLSNGWYLGRDENKFEFGVANNTTDDVHVESVDPFETGKWYYVCGVYNGTNASIYVNGSLQTSQKLGGIINYPIGSSLELRIGANNAANEEWNGTIDEVRIYNETLTDAQIYELYRSTNNWYNVTNNTYKNGGNIVGLLDEVPHLLYVECRENTTYLEQQTKETWFTNKYSVNLTNCSSVLTSTQTLVFELYDEMNQTSEIGSLDINFDIFNNTGAFERNYSFELRGDDNYTICLYPVTETFNTTAQLDFWNATTNFEHRSYFLINSTLDNTTSNVSLYMITDSDSSLVNFFVQDSSGDKLPNHYVDVQRYYVGENIYRTVTIMKTDDEGLAQSYFGLYDYWYKFIIKDSNGVVVDTIDSMTIKDTDIVFTTTAEGALEIFDYYGNIAHSCSFNNNTGYLSCTVTDSSGLADEVCLKVTEVKSVTSEIVCDDCYTYSGGITVGCNVADWAENYWYYALYLRFDEESIVESGDSDGFDIISGSLAYGLDGVALTGLGVSVISAIGFWNPVAAIILSLAALGAGIAMGFVVVQILAFISLVVIGIIIIFKMRSR